MKYKMIARGFAGFALTLIASPAMAHLDPAAHGAVAAGFTHPVFGADHVLAMVAVGIWAAMLGGRAAWAVPAAFVTAMALGFVLSLVGLPLPVVEPLILASVIVMGVLVALAVRVPMAAGMAIVALLALFHGYAHGTEMGGAEAIAYLAGFASATALLHSAGLALGLGLARLSQMTALRGMGGLVAVLGAWLAVAG
ncbi:MAG: HupE/UreJ family protein [Paracoccaceae bacterium]|uniref:HupE/UreJ family protein n=1 Tax=Seohaeicola saemankumensis TaxID=481181 RepID=UPI001E3240C3|nr:HupE/UreJ family protein [Seohaeicola saemankumensis]